MTNIIDVHVDASRSKLCSAVGLHLAVGGTQSTIMCSAVPAAFTVAECEAYAIAWCLEVMQVILAADILPPESQLVISSDSKVACDLAKCCLKQLTFKRHEAISRLMDDAGARLIATTGIDSWTVKHIARANNRADGELRAWTKRLKQLLAVQRSKKAKSFLRSPSTASSSKARVTKQ